MKTLLKIPYILLVSAVALLGLLLLMTLVPVPGNVRVKIVKSGSMEPAIPTGSIVVIKPAPSYFVGDVVTFGADTKTQIPTTHRITKIEGSWQNQMLTTKGDANDAEDPTRTPISSVHGKVIFHAPYLGFLLDFAKKPLGFALLVGIPAILIILDEIGKIWTEVRRLKLEKRRKEAVPFPGEKRMVDPFVLLLILAAPLLGFASRPSTISYYRANEGTIDNILRAGTNYPVPPSLLVAKLDETSADSPEDSVAPVPEVLGTTTEAIPPATTTDSVVEEKEEVEVTTAESEIEFMETSSTPDTVEDVIN